MGPVICLVTDRRRYPSLDRMVDAVAAAASGGVHLIQVRERDLEGRALAQLVTRCVSATSGTRARVVVNDRADVALAAGAHGVHLPSTGVPAARLRTLVPPGFLIGRSVHAAEEAERVCSAGGLDYLIFGPVFATSSKPAAAPACRDALRTVAQRVPVPVLAIGGVTRETLPHLRGTGAAGFAAIGLFADAAPDLAWPLPFDL